MKTYIGAKIINAEPMTNHQFLVNQTPSDKIVNTDFKEPLKEGYHVVYANPDGSLYHSWSPKDVFETAYREVTSPEKGLITIADHKPVDMPTQPPPTTGMPTAKNPERPEDTE